MEIIGPIIVVLFIVVPLIGVFFSKMRELSQPPTARPAQGDNRRIQEQIDEFLRRAGQQRRGGQPPPAQVQQAPQAAEVLDDDQVGSGVARQSQKYLDISDFRRRSEAMGGEVEQADQQFTQQVRNAFSGDVGKLSSRGGESAAAPEVIDAEVSEAEVLEADDPGRPTLSAAPPAGSGLAELLGSSDSIAHAIIMQEILRHPEW